MIFGVKGGRNGGVGGKGVHGLSVFEESMWILMEQTKSNENIEILLIRRSGIGGGCGRKGCGLIFSGT